MTLCYTESQGGHIDVISNIANTLYAPSFGRPKEVLHVNRKHP